MSSNMATKLSYDSFYVPKVSAATTTEIPFSSSPLSAATPAPSLVLIKGNGNSTDDCVSADDDDAADGPGFGVPAACSSSVILRDAQVARLSLPAKPSPLASRLGSCDSVATNASASSVDASSDVSPLSTSPHSSGGSDRAAETLLLLETHLHHHHHHHSHPHSDVVDDVVSVSPVDIHAGQAGEQQEQRQTQPLDQSASFPQKQDQQSPELQPSSPKPLPLKLHPAAVAVLPDAADVLPHPPQSPLCVSPGLPRTASTTSALSIVSSLPVHASPSPSFSPVIAAPAGGLTCAPIAAAATVATAVPSASVVSAAGVDVEVEVEGCHRRRSVRFEAEPTIHLVEVDERTQWELWEYSIEQAKAWKAEASIEPDSEADLLEHARFEESFDELSCPNGQ